MRKYLFIFFAATVFLPTTLWAFEPPAQPKGRVHDEARLLAPPEITNLTHQLEAYERATSNQLVVATFKRLGDDTIEDASIKIVERWKLGRADRDNGILLVIFAEDRAVRIEVGYGLEDTLTDAASSMIIQQILLPHFRKQHYGLGIQEAVNAIIQITQGEAIGLESSNTLTPSQIAFIIFVFIVILVLTSKFSPTDHHWTGSHRLPRTRWGGGGGGWSGGGSFGGGGGSFGGGGSSGRW